jgi:hypothetical protein
VVLTTDIRSPVVRTNPVTGWKSLFGAAHQIEAGWINDVTPRESDIIKAYCKSPERSAVYQLVH